MAPESRVDHGSGTAHTGLDIERVDRAILSARSAFHAGVAVDDDDFSIGQAQNRMRTDEQAHPAPDAFLAIQLQRNYILEIDQLPHQKPLM